MMGMKMWLSSREASERLGLNYETLKKSIQRLKNSDKKICQINGQYLPFDYASNSIGGNCGKILQIWIEEDENLNIRNNTQQNTQQNTQKDNTNGTQRISGDGFFGERSDAGAYGDRDTTTTNIQNKSGGLYGVCGNGGAKTQNGKMSLGQYRACGDRQVGEFTQYSNFDNECETTTFSSDNEDLVEVDCFVPLNDEVKRSGTKIEMVQFALSYSVKKACKVFDVSIKTLYRDIKKFQDNGLVALADKRGKKNKKVDSELIRDVIFASGSKHITSIYDYYTRKYNFLEISYSTFGRYYNDLIKNDDDIKNYMARGIDGVKYSYPSAPKQKRIPNQLWQIDATRLDVMCLKDGVVTRIQAVAVIDYATGYRVWGLYDSSSSYANVRLLKKAIDVLGKPTIIKGDNGSDYVSEHFQSVLGHLGISYENSPVGEGRAKGMIERNFRTVQHMPLFENLPGFIGHNVKDRNQIENQEIAKVDRFGGAKTFLGDLLTATELALAIDGITSQLNAKKGYTAQMTAGIENIDAHLGKRATRKLSKEGIKWNGKTYLSLELWAFVGWKTGVEVLIVENINDISRAYCWYEDTYIEVVDSTVAEYSVEEWRNLQKEFKKHHIAPLTKFIKTARKEKDGIYKDAILESLAKLKPIVEEKQKQLNKKEIVKLESPMMFEVAVANNCENIKLKLYRPSLDELLEMM